MSDTNNGSKSFELNWSDIATVGKNALLVGGAAALTVVAQNLHVIDLGTYGPVIVPMITIALDLTIKWMKNNSKKTGE